MSLYYYDSVELNGRIVFSDIVYASAAKAELERLQNWLNLSDTDTDTELVLVPALHLKIKGNSALLFSYGAGVLYDYGGVKWSRAKNNLSDVNLHRGADMPNQHPELIDFSKYISDAVKTECSYSAPQMRSIHALFGLSGEVGELIDAFKKTVFYGKALDTINIKEELGDLMWFIAILCDTHKIDLAEVLEKNIAKLKKRYPNKYNDESALNRDLAAEREALI